MSLKINDSESRNTQFLKVMEEDFGRNISSTKVELKEIQEDFGRNISRTNKEIQEIKKETVNNLSKQNSLNLRISNEIQTVKNEIKKNQNSLNLKISNEIRTVKNEIKKINQDKNCKPGWTKYWQKCYKLIKNSKSWSKDLCKSEGGSLVIINNAIMNDFIFSLTKGNNVWLGGFDSRSEGTWEWVDGTHMDHTFASWSSGEPNDWGNKEDCLAIRNADKNWNDAPCSHTFYYVCQA